MSLCQIQLKIIDKRIGQSVKLPAFQTLGSAGLDLYACTKEPLELLPNTCQLIPSGISIYIKDPRFFGMIAPRSGLGHKKGLILGNGVGIIDSDYQGELMISMWNRSETTQTINPLERIAQLLFIPVSQPVFEIVDGFEASIRGESGFGSTDQAETQLS
jgi:dUTP pyrophosphatase